MEAGQSLRPTAIKVKLRAKVLKPGLNIKLALNKIAPQIFKSSILLSQKAQSLLFFTNA